MQLAVSRITLSNVMKISLGELFNVAIIITKHPLISGHFKYKTLQDSLKSLGLFASRNVGKSEEADANWKVISLHRQKRYDHILITRCISWNATTSRSRNSDNIACILPGMTTKIDLLQL